MRSLSTNSLAAFLVILIVLTGSLRADDVESRFFQGLLDRELYRVAEDYAQRKLREPQLDSLQKVEFGIRLSQALCQHARLTSDANSDAIWAEAERVIISLQQSHPPEPSATLLQLQLSRIPADQTRALRFELEVRGEDPQLQQQALVLHQTAVDRLQQVQEKLKSLDSARAEFPTSTQRGIMAEEVQFLLAEAYVEKGRLLPSGPDRAGTWQSASELLEDLIRNHRDETYKWRSRLLRAYVARRQQDESTAETLLKSLLAPSADISGSLRDQSIAELARLRLDQGRNDEAMKALSDRVRQPPLPSPEIRAMIVECLIVLWQSAGRQGRADLQTGVIEQAEAQLQLTGGEWHRWAASRLEQIREERDFGPELAALLLKGRTAYQAGRTAEAIEAFGAAARIAETKQLTDKAVELLLTQGALQLQSQHEADASATFARVSQKFPDHPRAPEASLLKCYALGKVLDASATPEAIRSYQAALEGHLRSYPEADSSAETAWMLGLLHERLNQLPEAWRAFASVPLKHARSDEALLRMTLVVERLLAGPTPLDSSQVLAAVEELEQRLNTRSPDSQRLSLLQSEIALNIAGIIQQVQGNDNSLASRSAKWMDRVESAIDAEARDAEAAARPLDPARVRQKCRVTQLRIIALASQKRLDEATILIRRLEQTDAPQTLQVLQGLSELAGHLQETDRPLLGRLQLQAATTLNQNRSQLTPDQQQILDDCLLEANIAVGRMDDALSLYSSRSDSKANPEILRQISEQVLAEADPQNLKSTRALWTSLETRQVKGSPGWFTSRLMIARFLAREGASDDCRKLIGVTKIIYPDLGGPETAMEFQSVLKSLP